MTKKFLFFFLLLTVSFFGQTQDAILHFKDGTSLQGLGMIKKANAYASFRSEDKISFRITENDKPDLWTSQDVKGITFIGYEIAIEMEYVKVDSDGKSELLEIVTDGAVNLYKQTKIANTSSFSIAGNAAGNSFSGSRKVEIEAYYLKRKNEEYPTKIKDNYIKSTLKYFSDCELLVTKIKNHEFTYETLDKLVNFYNDICSEE